MGSKRIECGCRALDYRHFNVTRGVTKDTRAAALSGTGALTATAVPSGWARTADLSTTGTLSADSGVTKDVRDAALSGAGTLSATAVAGSTPVETLVDNFETQDAVKRTYLTGAVATGGQLVITPSVDYPGINSVAKYDLTGSQSICSFTPPSVGDGTNGGGIQLIQAVGYSLSIAWENNYLFFQHKVNTVADSTSVTYDAVNHKWLQIREAGGQIYWGDVSYWHSSAVGRRSAMSRHPLTLLR